LGIGIFLVTDVQKLPALLIMAKGDMCQAEVAVGAGRVRSEFQDDFGILQRLLKSIEMTIDLSAVQMGADVVRIELDRLGEIVQRVAMLRSSEFS
jgi:hypothetical protein